MTLHRQAVVVVVVVDVGYHRRSCLPCPFRVRGGFCVRRSCRHPCCCWVAAAAAAVVAAAVGAHYGQVHLKEIKRILLKMH